MKFLRRDFSLYYACTVHDMTAYALKHMNTGLDEETIRQEATTVLTKYLERYKDQWPTIWAGHDYADVAIEMAELVAKVGTKAAVAEAARRRAASASARAAAVKAFQHAACGGRDEEHVDMCSDEDAASSTGSSSSFSDSSIGLEEKGSLLIV